MSSTPGTGTGASPGTTCSVVTTMLDRTLTGEALELVLLHEMAHIGSGGAAHGPQFRRKLRRLVRLGAPARLLDDLERCQTLRQ
jgi:hypothetical protein